MAGSGPPCCPVPGIRCAGDSLDTWRFADRFSKCAGYPHERYAPCGDVAAPGPLPLLAATCVVRRLRRDTSTTPACERSLPGCLPNRHGGEPVHLDTPCARPRRLPNSAPIKFHFFAGTIGVRHEVIGFVVMLAGLEISGRSRGGADIYAHLRIWCRRWTPTLARWQPSCAFRRRRMLATTVLAQTSRYTS